MQADTRRTSEPAPLAGMDTSVCLDIGESREQKKKKKAHSWAGPQEAIWGIDNEINTEEQTKETALCTQYDCFNSQRSSQEGEGGEIKHTCW